MVRKIIKKITTVASYILLIIFLMPVLLWAILRIPAIQDHAVAKAMNWISETIGTEIQYSQMRISNFDRITINDLFIADQRGDTLLYARRATAVLPVLLSIIFDETSDKILLRRLELEKSTINFVIDSTSTINFQFIIDYLNSLPPSTKEKTLQRIRKIEITDSRFVLRNEASIPDSTGINFGNMQLNRFNLSVNDLTIFGDTINLDIEPLSFHEHSGFEVKEMNTHLELCKSHLFFSDVSIVTTMSSIDADHLNISFGTFQDFSVPELYTSVLFDLSFTETELNLTDIGYFTDFFLNTNQLITLDGNFSGPLSNFKGKELYLAWGENSHLSGNFKISELPDIPKTFLIFTLKELVSNSKDISAFNLPGGAKLNMPAQLDKIKSFTYQGNFTGFFNDFVSHGKLTTNLGVITTDIMFSPDSTKKIGFSGRLSTKQLDIGELMDNEDIEDISMDASIIGSYSNNEPLQATIDGNIQKLTFKKYPYQNISINGAFSNKHFDGKIKIDDPNLKMEFDGLVDMASEIRKYDFKVNVIDANLYALKLTDIDPEYHASFFVTAKAYGKSIDELNGEIHLLNSLFSKTGKQIQVFDFNVLTRNDAGLNTLSIRSELLDADISGKYYFSQLKNEFARYFYNFFPALTSISPGAENENSMRVHINFKVDFKRTESFIDFFFPGYYLSEDSELSGSFLPGQNNYASLTLVCPDLKIKSNQWKGLILNLNSSDSSLITSLGSESFMLTKGFTLESFSLEATTIADVTRFKTQWLNWDSSLYKGSVSGKVTIRGKHPENQFLVDLNPSSFTINDSVWNLNAFTFIFDSTGIGIRNLSIQHNGQHLAASGKLSDIAGDSMYFSFDNFDLANLNYFIKSTDIQFAGRLNGNANMTGLKNQPLFFSSIKISDLIFNEQEFGDCSIRSLWDTKKQSLYILAEAQRGKLTTLRFEGDYFPMQNGKMDFTINLDKLKTNILNPFMKGIFSDIRGLASGDLFLTGISGKPMLSGKLKLQKTSFTIDYLKTRYNFTTDIEIANNIFILNDIEIFDQEGNYGTMNGMVRTEYLKDIDLNLGINLSNLQCMNTRESDNSTFYGSAYATGSIKIKGSPSALHFDIDAETGKNTRIMIPLSQNMEVSEYGYISFSRRDTANVSSTLEKLEQTVNLSGMQMDFDLDVTPDAEIQIVFDPTIGDIIKAQGSGKMQLSINTLGTFEMVGEYTIDEGDYLFTLQNLINKHLSIESGSTMRWTGDPFNAKVDITAVYSTRASLSDLFEDENMAQRVNVDCRVFLTGSLMSPDISYDIYLPYADEETRNRVSGKIQSEEELSKQFLTLLVMNRFIPSHDNTGGSYLASSASSNAWELLSNQLNNWVSQSKLGVDLELAYRPGEEETYNQVEVSLSKQLLNDRLSINTNVDYNYNKTNAAAENNDKFVGDFDVDYKINKKGKVRVKAFSHSNENNISERSPSTQGVGIFYKEEFNTFGELLTQYWAAISGKKKKLDAQEADIDTN